MVQIDPGGAVASTFRGADPEAVIMATSSKDNLTHHRQHTTGGSMAPPTPKNRSSPSASSGAPVPAVVVEAYESQQVVVDELRDDDGGGGVARMNATDESTQNVIDLTDNSNSRQSGGNASSSSTNDGGGLKYNSTTNREWMVDVTSPGTTRRILVGSEELLTLGEKVSIVMTADDRNYDEVSTERGFDDEDEQRDGSLLLIAGAAPQTNKTSTAAVEQPLADTAVAAPRSSMPKPRADHGSSFMSAFCACIDPTYGYEDYAPAPTTTTTTTTTTTVNAGTKETPIVVVSINESQDDSSVEEDSIVEIRYEEGPVDAPSSTKKQLVSSYATTKPTSPPKPEEGKNIQLLTPISLYEDKSHMLDVHGEDEEGSEGDNLLNLEEDMASVPSVQEDVADSVAPMKPEDLQCSNVNDSSAVPSSPSAADIVEQNYKAVEISLEEAIQKSEQREREAANMPPPEAKEQVEKAKKDPTKPIAAKAKPSTPTKSLELDETLDARRRILTKELRSVVGTHGRYDLRCAHVSAALGDIMDEASDHGHAVKLHRDAVSIYSCKLGDDHSTTLKAKMRLGTVLENSGDIEQAINLYYQVTVMRKALRGEKNASVGDGLVCMARALRKKEDYIQAIKELKRALKIFRQSLGDSDEKVSQTVDDIASLYITIGDFAKSAAILEEVVKLKAATLGARSNQVGTTLLQLASAYECAGEQANAIRSLKKAYKIFSETGGHSGEDATTTLNRMAMLYEATKDHNRASVAYLGVLRSRKIHYGAQHTAVGETYFHLGRSLRLTKQFDKALKCLKEALPIFVGQGTEVEDVKMVADIMHEMAMVNQDRGNYKDAARIFKQELSVRRKIGQPNVPFISRTLLFMGIADYSMKNHNQALKHLVEALSLFQERGDEGLDCAKVLYYTGLVFEKVDNTSRAVEALAEAIRLFEDNDVDSDSKIFAHAQEKMEFLRTREHQ
jgi:tetratricopeptide (TPR) repeat protein